jgi:hypothetical protein
VGSLSRSIGQAFGDCRDQLIPHDCLEGRRGRALEPGDAQAPFSLSFRAWREVDACLVPPVSPGEAIQGADEDVADRHSDKEEPKRLEDGPHRRERTPFGLGLVPGRGPQGLPRTTLPTPQRVQDMAWRRGCLDGCWGHCHPTTNPLH